MVPCAVKNNTCTAVVPCVVKNNACSVVEACAAKTYTAVVPCAAKTCTAVVPYAVKTCTAVYIFPPVLWAQQVGRHHPEFPLNVCPYHKCLSNYHVNIVAEYIMIY